MRSAILAASLVLLAPASGWAQDEAPIRRIDIQMIGLSVDIDDGKRLGRNCRWRDQRIAGEDECTVTFTTIEAHGFDVARGGPVSMTAGEFGPARYRMAGRITALHYMEREFRRRTTVTRPGDVIVDTDGRVIGRMPATREEVWFGRDAPARVSATVEWSVLDSETEQVIRAKKVRGQALELGEALYNSMDDFIDWVVD